MNNWKLVVSLYFISFSALLQAESFTPHCPQTINTEEKLNHSPKGWESIVSFENNFLSGVSFYSHHPKEQAALKPFSINKKHAKWEFSKEDTIYIVCHYNETGIELTQALPKQTTACTVTFNLEISTNNGFVPKEISCTY